MSTMKPEAGQWWFPNNVKPGRSANQRAMFVVGYATNGDVIGQTSRDGAVTSWSNMDGWHHEPRCTGWDWVVPDHPQPAEDPDEWVIQDLVPVRQDLDRISWHGNSAACCIRPEVGGPSTGKKHGDPYPDQHPVNRHLKLYVMCRRRDLPKVEQAEPEPEPRVFRVTDGERYLTCQSFRDRFVLIPEDGGVPFTTIELSWHNLRKCPAVDVPSEKPEPQPELQPAEDPDEWVEITDPDHVLRSCDFFQIKDQSWHRIASSVGKTVAGCRYFAEAFRCRRRDLPKVEQAEQCSVGCHGPRCQNPALPGKDYCSECADEPQPQKTRVRLWMRCGYGQFGSAVVASTFEKRGDWREIHHDSEGFYVEGGQS